MGRVKAFGPNNISVEFLIHREEIMKTILFEVVIFFFQKKMIKLLNHTYLMLIPKKNSSLRLKDYKPISCVSLPYKLIARILTNRLMVVLSNIISPNQIGFWKGK